MTPPTRRPGAVSRTTSSPDTSSASTPVGVRGSAPGARKRLGDSEATDGSQAYAVYLREINAVPLLTVAEERALAAKVQAGDPDALSKLIQHNLRFVVKCARQFERLAPIEDLVQEGNIGLMKAAEKFDPTRGVRFVSYAAYWIEQAMRAHLASAQRAIRIPVNRNTQLLQVRRAVQALQDVLRHHPSVRDIALVTRLPEATVAVLQAADRQESSLQDPGEHGESAPLADRLPHHGPASDDRLMRADRALAINDLLAPLRPRDAQVLRLWFGIESGKPATLDEIGLILGVTRERVRQLRDRALTQLRGKATPEQRALLQEAFFEE